MQCSSAVRDSVPSGILVFFLICCGSIVLPHAPPVFAASQAQIRDRRDSVQTGSTKDTQELGRIVVSADRSDRVFESAQSVTFIRPDEWIGTGKGCADVIAEQTGVQTRRFGGRGSFQTVSIRGMEGSEVLVLLDGIPLNSSMGGEVDLGKIDPLLLSGIEVYRSFIPARFGGNGLGGVVNLISARPGQGNGGNLYASFGNYHTQDHRILVSHSPGGKVRLIGLLSFENSENDFPYLDRNNTFMGTLIDPTLDDTQRVMGNNRYTSGSLVLHPAISLGPARTLFTSVVSSWFEAQQPAEEGKRNLTARYTERMTGIGVRLDDEFRDNRFSVVPALGYLHREGYRFYTSLDKSAGASHSGLSGPDSHSRVGEVERKLTVPVTLYWRPAESLALESTVQLCGDDIAPSVNTTGGMHGNWHSSEGTGSAAADATAAFGPFGLTAGAGFRAILSATEGGTDGHTLKTIPEGDTVTYLWSARCGASLELVGGDLLLYCNSGRFSSSPSLSQRYGARGAHNPNPALLPEYGYSGELGVKYHGGLYAEACGFYIRSHDKIITVFDGRQSSSVNCDGTLAYGLELSLVWSVLRVLELDSRITLQHTENLSREYNWKGRRLPNEPGISIRESLQLGPLAGGFTLRYGITMNSFHYRNPANLESERVPSDKGKFWETRHQAKIEWKPLEHLTFHLSATEITNALLTSGEVVYSGEGSNSLVLVPANQFMIAMEYGW